MDKSGRGGGGGRQLSTGRRGGRAGKQRNPVHLEKSRRHVGEAQDTGAESRRSPRAPNAGRVVSTKAADG